MTVGARFLLIDGYNLLHAAGLARTDYRPDELRRQREKLLRLVAAQLSPAEVPRVTVIFDARDPTVDRPHTTRFAGMAVIFARPEGDADLVIGRWLDRHPAARHVTLVSGDRALQRAARGVGAQWRDSHEFLRDLASRTQRRSPPEVEKPEGKLSPEEAAAWSQWFGPVDLVGLAAEPDPDLAKPPLPSRPISGVSAEVHPTVPPRSEPTRVRKNNRPKKVKQRGANKRPKSADTNDAPRPDVQWHSEVGGSPPAVNRELSGTAELAHWLREFASLQDWVSRQESEGSWMRELERWWKKQ